VAFYASLCGESRDFWDAAYEAARRDGAWKPKNFWDRRAAAVYFSHTGRTVEETNLGQNLIRAAIPEYAEKGARAYVYGYAGNAYTQRLLEVFGPANRNP
jgi:hypothetical protein